ncbi:hypothetical protein DOTSEDRAFT_169930, partial [Dothistroma septosporum NZE10]
MAINPTQTHHSILFAAVAVLAAAFLVHRIRIYARLRNVPGPFLASMTDLWMVSKVWRGGHYHEIVYELHQKYGQVVRFGPNRVSFADPETIHQIYGTHPVFPKAPSYEPMKILAGGKEIMSLVTVRDEKKVTGVKRHVSAGFSQSTWLKQEDQIDDTLDLFMTQLRAHANQPISLSTWLTFWSFDTLTTLAFSESRGYLTAGRDLDNMFPSGHQRLIHWRAWAHWPTLEALIYKNWFTTRIQKATGPLAQLAMQRIQQRQKEGKEAGGRDLLARYLAASQAAPEVVSMGEVLGLTVSTIHAGSETMATTTSAVLAYLLWNPETMARLEEEILGAGLEFPPQHADVEHLEYLDSAIRETMRLNTSPNVAERTITSPGADIGGVYLPGGTDVSISEKCTTHDSNVYGANPDNFRPERWMNIDKMKWAEMDRVSFGFGFGRRECIGKHLARMEMKKVLAALIAEFKIVPAPADMKIGTDFEYVTLNVKLEPRNG